MLTVFNIQRYSVHDGNGVRTNIFLKGCPLHCLWCNNPESIDSRPSVMFDERLCKRFGDCIEAGGGAIFEENGTLVINRDKLLSPEPLREICPAKALSVVGREMSADDIITEIEKDIPFYEMSFGGVTLSGGEPLAQGEDLRNLLYSLQKKNIHVSVETSLHVPWEKIMQYIDFVDIFLADLKHTDALKFNDFTGGDLGLVADNFARLDAYGKEFVVRVPVIPGFNHTKPEIFSIIDTASGFKNAKEINFIPYHSLAKEKYQLLGMPYTWQGYRNVEKEELTAYAEYAVKRGLLTKILN